MAILAWDQVGSRIYETGIEKGVLYLPDGSAIPWSGLISIDEKFPGGNSTPIYFDGRKSDDISTLAQFAGTLSAITYPDEFGQFEGTASLGGGLYAGEQKPQLFNLSYRTKIVNDTNGEAHGYKIHILYNLLATPSDSEYNSLSDDVEFVSFEWDITSIPEEVDGFSPTSHIIIDSLTVDPDVLAAINAVLYGTASVNAKLLPFRDMIQFISEWSGLMITLGDDLSWTATENLLGYINLIDANSFSITSPSLVFLDADTFTVSNYD